MFFFKKRQKVEEKVDIPEIACAFTGHRPQRFRFKYDETHPDCVRIKKVLREQIEILINQGVNVFITGMALGTDTWCAEIVLDLKKAGHPLRLVAAIPCENQDAKWIDSSRRRYANILKKVDETIYVSREYTSDCMLKRNRYMVDRAQYLVAVYDGGYSGGTAATVRYAEKKGIKLIIINPDSCEVKA